MARLFGYESSELQCRLLHHHSSPLAAIFPFRRLYKVGLPSSPCNRSLQVSAAIQIDRRQYFEDLLKKQLESEVRQAEATLTCPLECVREVYTYNGFEKILQEAEEANDLVLVDFYSSSCGACKYLLPQVIRLCKKGCGETCSVEGRGVLFVKHNVRDEYDELTDLARFYSIRSVPMFMFFMNGSPVERLFTRDKHRLQQAVCQSFGQLFQQ